jgi:hypothetical protein
MVPSSTVGTTAVLVASRWPRAKVVELPHGAEWLIVADPRQEAAARLILARATLKGTKTGLLLSGTRENIIEIYRMALEPGEAPLEDVRVLVET